LTDWSPSRWARLKSSVDAALDAPSGGVSQVLRQMLAGETSLLAVARSLIAGRAAMGDFLEGSAATVSRKSTGALSPGAILADRYLVARLLGAGGMGEVYECRDSDLDESVAIKILRPEVAEDEALLERFRAELALGRRIQHPNVCRMYELHWTEVSGRRLVFLTMELLNGETLNDALGRGPLTEAEATPIADQVIAGVQAIHDAGILHGDLKCANIMLLRDADGPCRAVVMDFGLARRLDAIESTLTALAEGAFAGTPAYMPPEQLQGAAITPATDIHALGVVLYRMVTGQFPFPGRTALQIALHRLNGRARSPRRVNRAISRRWENVVFACLDASPARRPQSALEVGDILHGRKTVRRIRRFAAAAALLLAVSLAGVGVHSYISRPDAPTPEALRHYQLGQEFVDRRQGADLEQAVAEFERAIAIQPSYAPAHVGLAEAYSALSNWGLMEPGAALDRSRAAALRARELDPDLATAHAVLGYVISIDLNRWTEATPHFERALALSAGDPKVRLWYAAHLGRRGENEAALQQLRAGLALKPADMLLNQQLATEYFRGRRYVEFLAQGEELVRLQPFQANSHLVRARALEALGRYDEAIAACQEAEKFELDRSQLLLMLGHVAAGRGRTAEARRYAEEVERLPRPRPVDLAGLFARLGEPDRAMAHLRTGRASGDSSVLSAAVTPYFDGMRSSPAFVAFLQELGAVR
jgi:serine/threonine protein kinase